jgi:hypothetical protein
MNSDPKQTAERFQHLIDGGFSRAEAFTLIRDERISSAGSSSITSIGYPSPETPPGPPAGPPAGQGDVVPVAILNRVIATFSEALKPYLSEEDVQRLVQRALEGK